MSKMLDVYIYEKIIGQLKQDNYGEISFTYSNNWLSQNDAMPISCSLPLQAEPFKQKKLAFFNGILPEEDQRKLIAKNLGISANNDFSMLEKIGGECAGALSFIPTGESLHHQPVRYQELNEDELHAVLQELPTRPLLAGDEGIRLSLAGVQDKLAVYVRDKKIFIPLDSAPSTHIVKPDFTTYEGVIFNELFCLTLAKKIGLSVADAEIKKNKEISYLFVKRYDRIMDTNTDIKRIHQEDFCQALGIKSINKYQNEGGPSLKQCFELIRMYSSVPAIDLDKLLNAVIFNYFIGNCDAHGKNFSLLYLDGLQLAPLYDLISTIYYQELSKNMAMKLGGEYKIHRITHANFDKFAEEIQFSKPEVRKKIGELRDALLLSIPNIEIQHPIQESISELIKSSCLYFKI